MIRGFAYKFTQAFIPAFVLFFFFANSAFAEQPTVSAILGQDSVIAKQLDNWSLLESFEKPDKLVLHFQNNDNLNIKVHLEKRDDTKNTFSKTKSFNLFYKTDNKLADAEQQNVANLLVKLTELVNANDKGQFVFRETIKEVKREGYFAHWGQVPQEHGIWLSAEKYWYVDILERVVAILLYTLSVLGLFILLPFLLKYLNSFSYQQRLWFAVIAFMAFVVHMLVPHRLVMTYSGYGIIDQAIHFSQLKKYGAGTPFFYHSLFLLLPDTDKVYLWANTIVGWLTLPLAAIWFSRYMQNKSLAVVLILVLAIDPLILKNNNCESNFIPTLFFFFISLNWLEMYKEQRSLHGLFFAVVGFLLVIYSRPFFIIFIPLTLLAVQFTGAKKIFGRKDLKTILLIVLLSVITLLPHLVFLSVSYVMEMETGHAAGFSRVLDAIGNKFFSSDNLFLRYDVTPVVFGILWLWAIFKSDKQEKIKLAAIFAIGFVMFNLYFVDLPAPSIPRLQLPSHYFFCMITAFGFWKLWLVVESRPNKKNLQLALLAVTLVSVYPATWFLWAPINDWEEDKALRIAAELLPESAEAFVRLATGDEPHTFGIFREYPDYLFSLKNEELKISKLTDLTEVLEKERKSNNDISDRFYVYLGMRCYALIVDHRTGMDASGNLPAQNYQHPMCLEIREKYLLEPIYETMAVNHEIKSTFVWYPPVKQLKLGLYEIKGYRH